MYSCNDVQLECGGFLNLRSRRKPHKKWRIACVVIYASRVFVSLAKEIGASYTTLDIQTGDNYLFPEIMSSCNDVQLESHECGWFLNVRSRSKPHKKWRIACVVIYSSRVFVSLAKEIGAKRKNQCFTGIFHAPSYTALDLQSPGDNNGINDQIDQKSLSEIENVAATLQTDVENGVSRDNEDISRRHDAFGSNTYHKPPAKGFIQFVLEEFKDTTIIILLACAVLSLGFGIKEHGLKEGWYEGGSIFIAVFLVAAISASSNFRQSRQFDKLSSVSNNIQVEVVRDGRRQHISIFDIVVGDMVCLKIVNQIPADGLFLDTHSLQVDEVGMTGECEHVEVDGSMNSFLVTSVCMNTTWGEMMSSRNHNSNERTPLQDRLDKLTSYIGKVGLVVTFLVFVVLLVRYFTGNTKDENGNREFNGRKTKFNDVMKTLAHIIAAAITISKGLPLAVRVILAYSMKRMLKDQAMVRKFSACETMGSATTIYTDKTGTVALNQMKVIKFWLDQEAMGDDTVSITGDNVFSARAVVEGVEFRNKICVMAMSSPPDKFLMVQCLKQKGHVAAVVTGDGTNDAPALKEAVIGLSMGIQGNEVAKESSDIVILDHNFASVPTSLWWGRCVYNNIQKFIQFQLTVNIVALVSNFIVSASAREVPIAAVQLLWVNLITDTLGALALATEGPTKELMEKTPVGWIEPLITNIMCRNLIAQALYQIVVLLTLQFKAEVIFGLNEKVKDTLIFNTFILCQVFNEFNVRKLEKKNVFKGIHKNKLFMRIVGIIVVFQVVMVEFLKRFADTERLNLGQWGACIGLAAVSWPIDWVIKCIPVSDKPLLSSFLNP